MTENETEQIITRTKNWVSNVVVGCNFCPFAAKEVRTLPIVFYISNDIDPSLNTLTLSYTFFEAIKPQADASTNNSHLKL